TSSLIFSIACGVNLTRLPLADELAFVIVMFLHFFPCGHSVSALRPSATPCSASSRQSGAARPQRSLCIYGDCCRGRICRARRQSLRPAEVGCRRHIRHWCQGADVVVEVDVMTRDVRSPSFAYC